MKIQEIITESEFNTIKYLSYDKFCDIASRFIKLCVEESLKAIPQVITHLANQTAYLKQLSDDFYSNNKDLVEHKKLVAQVIEKIEAENPGKSYKEILSLAAPRAKHLLSIKGQMTLSKD